MNDEIRLYGYIHQFRGSWGLIKSPKQAATGWLTEKFFLHKSKLKSGRAENGAYCEFIAGSPRTAGELRQAFEVKVTNLERLTANSVSADRMMANHPEICGGSHE